MNQNRGDEVGNILAAIQHRELAAHLDKLMSDADVDNEVDSECSDDQSVVSFENNEDDYEEDDGWAQVDDPREGHLELTDELHDEEEKLPDTPDDFDLDDDDADEGFDSRPETSHPARLQRSTTPGCGQCGCTRPSSTLGCCTVCHLLFLWCR